MRFSIRVPRWLIAGALLATPAAALGQIFTWTSKGDQQNNPWMASMVWAGFSAEDDADMVARLRALPQGKRCLFLASQTHAIFTNADDGAVPGDKVYWPAGIATARAVDARLLAALSAGNVKPDIVLLDDEEEPNSYNMTLQQMIDAETNPHTNSLPWPALPFATRDDEYQFNNVITTLEREALHTGVLADFEQYAPDALTCNFAERMATDAEAQQAPDPYGNPYAMGTVSGNAQAPGMYLSATGYAPTQTPYGLAAYGTSVLRVSIRHSPVLPWYGSESVEGIASWAGTGYWEEFVRHGLLTCGVQGMLFDANDDKAAARVSTILFDLRKNCNGTLPSTLITTDVADSHSQWFASARMDTDNNGVMTRLIARVTFAPGVSKATLVLQGKTFNVTRPAHQVGAWVRWNRASSTSLY